MSERTAVRHFALRAFVSVRLTAMPWGLRIPFIPAKAGIQS